MNPNVAEWHNVASPDVERPSEDFIRAVADLLETDADDFLSEMGYSFTEALAARSETVQV